MIHYLIRLLMLLVFIAAMADVWSTNRAIATGGAHEANPVMAFFMRVLGSGWVLARLAFALVNIWFVIHSPSSAETWKGLVSFSVNIAITGYAVLSNIKLGNKA